MLTFKFDKYKTNDVPSYRYCRFVLKTGGWAVIMTPNLVLINEVNGGVNCSEP